MKIFSLKAFMPLALAGLVGVSLPSFGQDSTAATKTSSAEVVKMAPLKTFGGAKQYSSWSIGVNLGALAPVNGLGGLNQYSKYKLDFGYSAFVKWQIQHSFGVRVDYLGGQFTANSNASSQNPNYSAGAGNGADINSKLSYAFSVKGEVDVAAIDFLRRQNAVRVFLTGGYGLAGYKPDLSNGKTITAGFVPVGAGLKIRASQSLAINLGYDVMFFDASNLFGTPYINKDGRQNKGSFAYAGLEYTFGTSRKPAMVWVNPVAVMYDELKANDSLAKEVDGLKTRVGAVEGDVARLKKDSDGDGVSDVFDKCPNTPAGTKVDGSGCELPKMQVLAPDTAAMVKPEAPKDRVQFAFDSDVITTDSYPTLNNLATELKSSKEKITLSGHASSEGTEAYNLGLSKRRATSVKKFLVGAGVPSKQIKTVGYGESRPIASNDTEEGRQKNRRVEFRSK